MDLTFDGGSTVTSAGVPGAGIAGQPAIYATLFPGGGFMIEPQVAFNLTSMDSTTTTYTKLAEQVGLLFSPHQPGSLYVAANLAQILGTQPDHYLGLGGVLGYRIRVGQGLVLRTEGEYRRWFDHGGFNEIRLALGIGAVAASKY